jgi:hypothetical protein
MAGPLWRVQLLKASAIRDGYREGSNLHEARTRRPDTTVSGRKGVSPFCGETSIAL